MLQEYQANSEYAIKYETWTLKSLIVKSNDDVRQEVLALQLGEVRRDRVVRRIEQVAEEFDGRPGSPEPIGNESYCRLLRGVAPGRRHDDVDLGRVTLCYGPSDKETEASLLDLDRCRVPCDGEVISSRGPPPAYDVEVLRESSQRYHCLLYTSPSPRDVEETRMPSSA